MKHLMVMLCTLQAFSLNAQWEPVPAFHNTYVVSVQTQFDRIWVLTNEGLNYQSDDRGHTWKHWKMPDSLEARDFWKSDSMVMTRTLMPGQPHPTHRIYLSYDLGNTWRLVSTDSSGRYDYFRSVCAAGPYVFIATRDKLYRSADLGANWETIPIAPDQTYNQRIYTVSAAKDVITCNMYIDDDFCGPIDLAFKSKSFGNTWERILPYTRYHYQGIFWIADNDDSRRYVTQDNGTTFQYIPAAGLGFDYTYAASDKIYGFKDEQLFRLSDDGQLWETVDPLPTCCIRDVEQTPDEAIWVGSSLGLWRKSSSSTAVIDLPDEQLCLRPNPAVDFVSVQWPQNQTAVNTLEVYNALGQLMETTNLERFASEYRLNTSAWAPGIYFIRHGTESAKLWKQ